jgi:hypothetical protein
MNSTILNYKDQIYYIEQNINKLNIDIELLKKICYYTKYLDNLI